MRISDSQISGLVSHRSQQLVNERDINTTQHNQFALGEGQQVVLRHESVDLLNSEYYESERSSRLYSKSTILNADSSQQKTITQEELASSLTSGVLERDVHIGSMLFDRSRSSALSFSSDLGVSVTNSELEDPLSSGVATQTSIELTQQKILERTDSLTLVSEGQVTTDDGRSISFRLELDLDQRYFERSEQTLSIQSEDMIDPLVISLDGKPPTLSNSTFTFDIDSDGELEELSSLASGAGFLAFDQNKDGVINNGSELFGPQSGNGYEDLAAFDDNGDGWIDESDEIFSQLTVWQPGEGDENGVMVSLNEAGVGAISLQAMESPFVIKDEHNNTLGVVQRSGVYLSETGQAGLVQQIDLAIQAGRSGESQSTTGFSIKAEDLERRLQQHISDNQEELFINRATVMDPNSVSIQETSGFVELVAPPITIVSREFQLVERVQELFTREQSSFSEVVVEPVMAKQESVDEQVAEAITKSTNDTPLFSGVKRSDTLSLGFEVKEDKHAVLSSIIEDVLRPLHEQLKLNREKASEVYVEGSKR